MNLISAQCIIRNIRRLTVRNAGIIAHIDAGKTTLTESILFHSGLKSQKGLWHSIFLILINLHSNVRPGTFSIVNIECFYGLVDAGTTTTDYLVEERERGVTIQSAIVSIDWSYSGKTIRLNLFDTPGHADFRNEVEQVLPALDFCILLLDASKGIETQTKTVLRLAQQEQLPIICFANKMDKDCFQMS